MMELWITPGNTDYCEMLYKNQVEKHNQKVVAYQQGKGYADSGFDLYIPWNPTHSEGKWVFPANTTIKIPLGIKMVNRVSGEDRLEEVKLTETPHQNHKSAQRLFLLLPNSSALTTSPFYIYARSSISKTPLRLANNQGIIDAGYRGELMIALDNITHKQWELDPGTRLVQACQSNLIPFKTLIVNEDFEATERGAGGFGSTGK